MFSYFSIIVHSNWKCLCCNKNDWLMDWLIDRSIHPSIDRWMDRSIDRSIDWCIWSLINDLVWLLIIYLIIDHIIDHIFDHWSCIWLLIILFTASRNDVRQFTRRNSGTEMSRGQMYRILSKPSLVNILYFDNHCWCSLVSSLQIFCNACNCTPVYFTILQYSTILYHVRISLSSSRIGKLFIEFWKYLGNFVGEVVCHGVAFGFDDLFGGFVSGESVVTRSRSQTPRHRDISGSVGRAVTGEGGIRKISLGHRRRTDINRRFLLFPSSGRPSLSPQPPKQQELG